MKNVKRRVFGEFADPSIQKQLDALEAKFQSPEWQAKRQAELPGERRQFWRSWGLLAVMVGLGLAGFSFWLHQALRFAAPDGLYLSLVFSVVVAMAIGKTFYPRA